MSNKKSSKQWKKFPQTLDDNYRRRLKPITDNLRKEYEKTVEPELKSLTENEYIDLDKISFDDSVEERIKKLFHGMRVGYYGVNYPLNGDPKTLAWRNKVDKQVEIEGKSVARVHKKRYGANVNVVLGVNPMKNQKEPWLTNVLKDWTAQNVSLIKGIPDFAIDSLQATVTNSVLRGDSMTFLKNQIAKVLGDSDRRLKLIARDQTNKLYGALTKFRSQSNGWDFYQWSDSNDSRVRVDHSRLDKLSASGGFFRFSDPPVIVTTGKRAGTKGNPGDDIQCRCVAIVSFLPEWRFKAASNGSYRLIPVSDLPDQLKRIA